MNAKLQACGEALYGEFWMGRMADALGISDRSLRRWANGQMDVPDGVWDDLSDLMRERRALLDAALLIACGC